MSSLFNQRSHIGPSLDDLIAASARGDEQALQRLYRATADTLFGVALRILRHSDWAEQVLQESFVSVWRHARRFDRAKGAPMTWLIRIVRNARTTEKSQLSSARKRIARQVRVDRQARCSSHERAYLRRRRALPGNLHESGGDKRPSAPARQRLRQFS
ncbi:MAG: sigma factor [Burkholderiales bacterium]